MSLETEQIARALERLAESSERTEQAIAKALERLAPPEPIKVLHMTEVQAWNDAVQECANVAGACGAHGEMLRRILGLKRGP